MNPLTHPAHSTAAHAAIKCPGCRATGAVATDRESTCHRCSGIGWLRTTVRTLVAA